MSELFREWEVEEAGGTPIRVRLGGIDLFFTPAGECPFGLLADYSTGIHDGKVGMAASLEFLKAVVLEDSAELLNKMLYDTNRPVSPEKAQSIVDWLLSCYAGGRPTGPPSGSSDGRRSTTDSSGADSSSQATKGGSGPARSSTSPKRSS